MDISVIIVTYNSAGCIAECVDSVRRQPGVSAEILVIDNTSADKTVDAVRALGGEVRLTVNSENVGFGRACNQGFAASQGRFVFLLNPDARMETAGGLAQLVRVMEQHPRWGITGMRLLDEHGEIESVGETSYPSQARAGRDFSHLPGRLAWVSGACLFIRREAYRDTEGFDPGFFLSSEETDLCLRARERGWEIGFVPEVTVRHIGMASEHGIDPYQTWNRRIPGIIRFWTKHYSPEGTRRLLRREWFRAGFRTTWYGVVSRFTGRDSTAWRKHRRYAGIRDAASQARAELRKRSA